MKNYPRNRFTPVETSTNSCPYVRRVGNLWEYGHVESTGINRPNKRVPLGTHSDYATALRFVGIAIATPPTLPPSIHRLSSRVRADHNY